MKCRKIEYPVSVLCLVFGVRIFKNIGCKLNRKSIKYVNKPRMKYLKYSKNIVCCPAKIPQGSVQLNNKINNII